jgi:hypothetical protein
MVPESWTYSSWIYNYLCNQCLSPLKLWIWTPFMARSHCTRYNIMCGFLRVLQFPPTNKTVHHDITAILLKVALNTINQPSLVQMFWNKKKIDHKVQFKFNVGYFIQLSNYMYVPIFFYIAIWIHSLFFCTYNLFLHAVSLWIAK